MYNFILDSHLKLLPKRLLAYMFSLNKIVKDGILEISFSSENRETKIYTITNSKGIAILQGKITGQTQRTCLYVGDLKKGQYTFSIGDDLIEEFNIQ